LARQYHDYGRWRREVARRHPSTLSVRYLAAPVTVATIAAGLGAAAVGVMRGRGSVVLAGLAPLAVYAAGNVAASVWTGARIADPPAALRLPAVFATMHGAWGVGFWRGGAGGGTRR